MTLVKRVGNITATPSWGQHSMFSSRAGFHGVHGAALLSRPREEPPRRLPKITWTTGVRDGGPDDVRRRARDARGSERRRARSPVARRARPPARAAAAASASSRRRTPTADMSRSRASLRRARARADSTSSASSGQMREDRRAQQATTTRSTPPPSGRTRTPRRTRRKRAHRSATRCEDARNAPALVGRAPMRGRRRPAIARRRGSRQARRRGGEVDGQRRARLCFRRISAVRDRYAWRAAHAVRGASIAQ